MCVSWASLHSSIKEKVFVFPGAQKKNFSLKFMLKLLMEKVSEKYI